jgi:prepilin-type N-terminal cleavage/methylation domain-containing protein
VKRRKLGLTLIELLTVIAIMALLVGLLVPAVNVVRDTAKEARQKAQFAAIQMALAAFKNDYGDYPPSDGGYFNPAPGGPLDYCGAQKLAEALLGWDLLGFHPKSDFRSNGYSNDGFFIYDTNDPIFFDQRKGPYLELATTGAFKLGDLFMPNPTGPLAPYTFVICDVFGTKKIVLPNGESVKAGAPVLYYRANTSGKTIREIYSVSDNDSLVLAKQQADVKEHPLTRPANQFQYFYDYIREPKIDARPWPYRPDSYILISAGEDGLYGTGDDICNFGN